VKVCVECQRIYLTRLDECPECGCKEYNILLFPFYNDIEQYQEEENGSKEMDKPSD